MNLFNFFFKKNSFLVTVYLKISSIRKNFKKKLRYLPLISTVLTVYRETKFI